jgi:hypothetical protein
MGNKMLERIAVDKYMIALLFQTTNIPDAAGTMKTTQVDSDDYVMPFKGSIVGLSIRQNAALSGGELTFKPTLAGTAVTGTGLNCVLNSSAQQAHKSQLADIATFTFAAGARLGIAWTKTGTVAATTTDAVATLFVLVEVDDL